MLLQQHHDDLVIVGPVNCAPSQLHHDSDSPAHTSRFLTALNRSATLVPIEHNAAKLEIPQVQGNQDGTRIVREAANAAEMAGQQQDKVELQHRTGASKPGLTVSTALTLLPSNSSSRTM